MTWHVTVYEFDDDDNELDRTVTNSPTLREFSEQLTKVATALDESGYSFREYEPMPEENDSDGECIVRFSFEHVDGTTMDVELSISD